MDHYLLELTAGNLALRETMKAIRGRPQAVLMVEFSGDDDEEVADRVEKLRRRLGRSQRPDGVRAGARSVAARSAVGPAQAGMPLLYGMRGDRKPVTFVEDSAVAPERLPEFVARFREMLKRHGTDGAFYGHASVGCLHIRPVLNLKDPDDVARMRRITEDVTDLVLEFGGSLSGEHGDGLARSEWNEKMFGPTIYEAFREVKAAFDPDGLLNPGKIVDAPRDDGEPPLRPRTIGRRSRPRSSTTASRKVSSAPSKCATATAPAARRRAGRCARRSGRRSTRTTARAAGPTPCGWRWPASSRCGRLRSQWVHDVFDLCLMCKACKAECPSNVDVAKLKAELLELIYQGRPRPLGHLLMAAIPSINRLGAPLAPLVNWLQEQRPLRWLLEKAAGIDRRRSLPSLHANHFRRWFARHKPDAAAGRVGRVLLLDDCFTTYNEPAVGRAAVRVLERAGYAVELAEPPLLRPAAAQQGLSARHAVAGPGAGAGAGPARRRRHADPRAWSRVVC